MYETDISRWTHRFDIDEAGGHAVMAPNIGAYAMAFSTVSKPGADEVETLIGLRIVGQRWLERTKLLYRVI